MNCTTSTITSSRARYGDKLAYAGCRLEGSSREFPALSPIFIASKEAGVVLCRVEPSLQRPCAINRALLYFDDSVHVIHMSRDNIMDVDSLLFYLLEAIPLRRFRISICSTDVLSSSKEEEEKLPTCYNPNRQVRAVNCHDLLDRHIQSSCFCGIPLSWSAGPVLSISIRAIIEPGIHLSHNPPTALESASIKRQLAGVHVAFLEGKLSSSLSLVLANGNPVTYYVEAVSARGPRANPLLYVILPSTRISILPAKDIKSTKRVIQPNDLEGGNDCGVSSMIIRTARCLRGVRKASVARSFLLTGPPGVGKTFAVKRAFDVCQADGPMLFFTLESLLSSGGGPGEVSRILVEHFERAASMCNSDPQCVAIMFVDECDSLLQSKIVAAVFSSLLDRTQECFGGWQRMILVAATNHAETIPAFLWRPGRIDKKVHMKPPTASERAVILNSQIRDVAGLITLKSDDLREISEICVGYVAADLVALIRRVFTLALEEPGVVVGRDIFQRAMGNVRASSLRASTTSAPQEISWKDVGRDPAGAQDILRRAIEWPRTKLLAFGALGLQSPSGILLYGPPGCAKTTLARAASSAAGTAFIAFAPSDVYASSYLGEAEAVIRGAFTLARSSSPCILFFDEIDSILSSDRGGGSRMDRSERAESRVLSTFLNEMDGVDGSTRDGVLVLGATNRPWTLDAALMRSGRFDKAIFVSPPDFEGRLSILKIICRGWSISTKELEGVASEEVSAMMTGAELVGACHTAALLAVKSAIETGGVAETIRVTTEHLRKACMASDRSLSGPNDLIGFQQFEESRISKGKISS